MEHIGGLQPRFRLSILVLSQFYIECWKINISNTAIEKVLTIYKKYIRLAMIGLTVPDYQATKFVKFARVITFFANFDNYYICKVKSDHGKPYILLTRFSIKILSMVVFNFATSIFKISALKLTE